MSELLHEYINELLREEAEVGALMRDVDDILDDALRDAAPEIVRDIREREVDEDIDEFIDGAMHGSWDTKELSYADVPNVGDHAEVRDEGDNEEVTEMYRLGYQWGWDNPGKIDKGEHIPDGIRREMVEYALENFKSRLTEEFVINAFEKAIGYVKKQMGDVHDILKKAKEKFGWKFAPALVGIEVVEHAVLPTALGAIHPIFYGLAAVPTVEILAASALAIAKARMPSTPKAELPPGHLDWYEDEYQKASNESLVREYIRSLLIEQNVLAQGMCFPFAYKKAEEWFDTHFTKGKPGRSPKRHPDLNNKDKFKIVHGTVTDKWEKPPKPVVHGWVEMGDLVFDDQTKHTKPDGIPKEVYYDMFQPEPKKEFTAEEAVVNCIKYGGEGPWDEELYAQLQQRDAWKKD